jgi:tyrosine-specific transport protein
MGHVVGGTLLIAGTTIGVGMLALPIATGEAGFFPSMSIYLLCWLFMLCTGLALLEVCQWMPKDANLITMAYRLLGPWGRGICWVFYLFLFVTVMIAHIVGGGDVLHAITKEALPRWMADCVYVILFAPIIYLGTHFVDRVNLILMIGVVTSYVLFILFSHSHVNTDLLLKSNWSKSWIAIPIIFTAFTYQVIIPTLMTYMERNVKKVKLAIILGTTIPLVVYLVWEVLILGIVPIEGLHKAKELGQNAVWPLKQIIGSSQIFNIGKAFAFFTLTTSYLALSLAYLDFLSDGLKIKKTHIHKIGLCLLIFIPPLLVSISKPHIFFQALNVAGGYSCAILFGLFPPLMVWIGRYIKKQPKQNQILPGGKLLLGLLILFILIEIGIEIFYVTLQKIL